MWIRRVRCRRCGGPKVTPSKTAYVYCSYCGTLMDWDFQIASHTIGSARPGPQYEALKHYLAPVIEAARRRADKAAMWDAQCRLYDLHVQDCPAAYSPRVRDRTYRDAIIGYHARCEIDRLFDAQTLALEEVMERVGRTMFWVATPEGNKARPDRFFALFYAYRAVQARIHVVAQASGTFDRHPDKPGTELILKMADSAYLQGWIANLDKPTIDQVLEITHLKGEFDDMAPVATSDKPCGTCGVAVPVPAGATCVLCEQCGTLLDAGEPSVKCPGCGGLATRPHGASHFACPYCRTELAVVGARHGA